MLSGCITDTVLEKVYPHVVEPALSLKASLRLQASDTVFSYINLVQGKIDVGRSLLQRALVIQEGALGPEHPDVVAIKDVLDESDDS